MMIGPPSQLPIVWCRALAGKFPAVERPLLELVAYTIVAAHGGATLEDLGASLQAMAADAWHCRQEERAIQFMLLGHVAWSESWRRQQGNDVEADIALHALFGLMTPRPLDLRVPEICAYLAGQVARDVLFPCPETLRRELTRQVRRA